MNISDERIEAFIPLYAGVLGALILCSVIAVNHFGFRELSSASSAGQQEDAGFSLAERVPVSDPVIEYYRNSDFQEWVIDFFTEICNNREIAKTILYYSDQFNVPAALAFALSWEESNFHPRAVNRGNRDGSIDRGLFQLNNRSFPNLKLEDFFDIKTNIPRATKT